MKMTVISWTLIVILFTVVGQYSATVDDDDVDSSDGDNDTYIVFDIGDSDIDYDECADSNDND